MKDEITIERLLLELEKAATVLALATLTMPEGEGTEAVRDYIEYLDRLIKDGGRE